MFAHDDAFINSAVLPIFPASNVHPIVNNSFNSFDNIELEYVLLLPIKIFSSLGVINVLEKHFFGRANGFRGELSDRLRRKLRVAECSRDCFGSDGGWDGYGNADSDRNQRHGLGRRDVERER